MWMKWPSTVNILSKLFALYYDINKTLKMLLVIAEFQIESNTLHTVTHQIYAY